jgi:hypothetical protein
MSVVRAIATPDYLMLDADYQTKERVVRWAIAYAKYWKLGCILIMETSDRGVLDLFGNRLYSFIIIFGRRLPWEEIKFHIRNALADRIVDETFLRMRFLGVTTERVGEKNAKTQEPRRYRYIWTENDTEEDREGVIAYLRFWTHKKIVDRILEEAKERDVARRKRSRLRKLKTRDDAVYAPKREHYWVSPEQRARRRKPTDIYQRDVKRILKKCVIANMEMKWELS